MSVFLKTLKIINRIFLYIGCASIFVMACITVVDVFMRFVFRNPITGVTEICQMLLVVAMATLGHSLIEGRFISVGVIVDMFPRKINITLEILMGAISCIFFAVIGWQLLVAVEFSMRFNEFYFMLKTPKWPFYAILGASFLAAALASIVYVIERVTNFKSAKDKGVFDDNPELAILALAEDDESNKIDKEGGMK